MTKVKHRNSDSIASLSTQEFEKLMGICYLSRLKYPTYTANLCPYLLKWTSIGEDNRNLGQQYKPLLDEGFIADVSIQWIDTSIGYGLFADSNFKEGDYIGEYTGIVRPLSRTKPDHNEYCVHYPTRFWSWNYHIIDALAVGNEIRYVNHSDYPNLKVRCLIINDILHFVMFAKTPINQGEELTCYYGEDFWQHRRRAT